jgi:hypothetical protein
MLRMRNNIRISSLTLSTHYSSILLHLEKYLKTHGSVTKRSSHVRIWNRLTENAKLLNNFQEYNFSAKTVICELWIIYFMIINVRIELIIFHNKL